MPTKLCSILLLSLPFEPKIQRYPFGAIGRVSLYTNAACNDDDIVLFDMLLSGKVDVSLTFRDSNKLQQINQINGRRIIILITNTKQ